mgnify:FL=1
MYNNLVQSIDTISSEIVSIVNTKLSSSAFMEVFGGGLSDLMEDSDQATQDTTKLLQYIVNNAIVEVMNTRGIDGRKDETTGHDYVIDSYPVEFKLMGGCDSSSFATGNKISATGGAKCNLVWCFKYTVDNNLIDTFASILVDTDKVTNPWNAGKGRKDSYSTLKVECVDGEEAVLWYNGILKEARKFLQLHTIPVDLV